jgi:2-dehydro-3-deoxygluconokinase
LPVTIQRCNLLVALAVRHRFEAAATAYTSLDGHHWTAAATYNLTGLDTSAPLKIGILATAGPGGFMQAPSRPRVLCAGETMAMVVPRERERLRTARDFLLGTGGAESNVAMYLADYGARVSWFSALGTDALGDRILDVIAGRGVDVSLVRRDAAHPTGLYVKDPRPDGTSVRYYRAGSAASFLDADALDAVPVREFGLVHVSGITPALSASAAALTDRLFGLARDGGARMSFDVNFRPGLWDTGTAAPVLRALARRADIVFTGQDEAVALWGTSTPDEVAAELGGGRDGGLVVVKDAADGATELSGSESVFEPALPVEVVEHVGAGDAFAAGYLAALLAGDGGKERLAAGHRGAAWTLGVMEDHRPLPEGAARWT